MPARINLINPSTPQVTLILTSRLRLHGIAHGETDEIGFEAEIDKVHAHDLHAAVLHLMGLDHKLLTYFHQGRDERLADVYGKVVKAILA